MWRRNRAKIVTMFNYVREQEGHLYDQSHWIGQQYHQFLVQVQSGTKRFDAGSF